MPPFFIFLGLDKIKKVVYYMNHKNIHTRGVKRQNTRGVSREAL